MEQPNLQSDDGHQRREKSRGRLSAADVLKRYKEDDLAAFGEIDLTNVNQVGLSGEHPLDIAAVRGDREEIYALLDGGADINAPGELGYTALHEAVGQGHVDAVHVLLEFGARTDIRNEFGDTAADIASMRKRDEILALLRSKGQAD